MKKGMKAYSILLMISLLKSKVNNTTNKLIKRINILINNKINDKIYLKEVIKMEKIDVALYVIKNARDTDAEVIKEAEKVILEFLKK
jgi:hypothetical protein